MPRTLKLTEEDYSKGKKRFLITLSIPEMERLIALSGYSEPPAKATEWLRERIEKEYGNRRSIPGQTHLFEKVVNGKEKKKRKKK